MRDLPNKLKSLVAISVLALTTACSKSDGKRQSVIIGLQPNEATADNPAFAKNLSDRTGLDIKIDISKDYESIVQKFKAGQIDFAFFSPFTFLMAEDNGDAKVLLKKVYTFGEVYYSAIIVREDSPAKTLKDLEGKKIALVDLKSTSGYLYPRYLFKKAGVDFKKLNVQFLGTHDAAVEALLDGKVDAAGVWSGTLESKKGAWSILSQQKKINVRALKVSDEIPNDPFAVRKSFFSERQEDVFKIMNALIDMSEKGDNVLKKVFDTDKMATATSRHYDGVREVYKELQKDLETK